METFRKKEHVGHEPGRCGRTWLVVETEKQKGPYYSRRDWRAAAAEQLRRGYRIYTEMIKAVDTMLGPVVSDT